jgi:hypothetical protein
MFGRGRDLEEQWEVVPLCKTFDSKTKHMRHISFGRLKRKPLQAPFEVSSLEGLHPINLSNSMNIIPPESRSSSLRNSDWITAKWWSSI